MSTECVPGCSESPARKVSYISINGAVLLIVRLLAGLHSPLRHLVVDLQMWISNDRHARAGSLGFKLSQCQPAAQDELPANPCVLAAFCHQLVDGVRH